jgi:hypothetical protein
MTDVPFAAVSGDAKLLDLSIPPGLLLARAGEVIE